MLWCFLQWLSLTWFSVALVNRISAISLRCNRSLTSFPIAVSNQYWVRMRCFEFVRGRVNYSDQETSEHINIWRQLRSDIKGSPHFLNQYILGTCSLCRRIIYSIEPHPNLPSELATKILIQIKFNTKLRSCTWCQPHQIIQGQLQRSK